MWRYDVWSVRGSRQSGSQKLYLCLPHARPFLLKRLHIMYLNSDYYKLIEYDFTEAMEMSHPTNPRGPGK